MSARRRPPTPPERSGRLFVALVVVLTVVIPGVGHIYANMILRGFLWLAGNIALLLIVMQADRTSGPMLLALAALRLAALVDVLLLLRANGWRSPPPGR